MVNILRHAIIHSLSLQSILVLANNGPYNPNFHHPPMYAAPPEGFHSEAPTGSFPPDQNNIPPNYPPHYSSIPAQEHVEIPSPQSTGQADDASSTLFIPATSTSQRQLFGSDLSQIDKDYIFEGLKTLYKKKVLPLELATKYSHFGSPPMGPSDFEAKPMVLILGQVLFSLIYVLIIYYVGAVLGRQDVVYSKSFAARFPRSTDRS